MSFLSVVGGGAGAAALAPASTLTLRPTCRAVSLALSPDDGTFAIATVDISDGLVPALGSPSFSVLPVDVTGLGTGRVLAVHGAYDWDTVWKSWALIAHSQKVFVYELSATGSIAGVWSVELTEGFAGQNILCGAVLDGSVLVVATDEFLLVSRLPRAPSFGAKDVTFDDSESVLSVDVLVRGMRDSDGLCREVFAIGKKNTVSVLFRLLVAPNDGVQVTNIGAVRVTKESVPLAYVAAGGAALDAIAGILVIAWSDGRVSWVSTASAICMRRCVMLSRTAGVPCAIRLAPSVSRVFVTIREEGGDLQLWVISAPSAVAEYSLAQCVEAMDPRGVAVVAGHGRGNDDFDSSSQNTILICAFSGSDVKLSLLSSVSVPQFSTVGRYQLGKVQLRLDTRLRSGIAALVEAKLVVLEKERILQHARQMLHHVTGNSTTPSPSRLFLENLEPVLEEYESGGGHRGFTRFRRAETVASGKQASPSRDPGARLPAYISGDDDIVQLVGAEHFLDPSRLYLYFAVDATISTIEPCRVWIEVQLGAAIWVRWEALEFQIERGAFAEKRCCLITRVLMSDLVSCCSNGLSDLCAEIRAVSSSGRVQFICSFTVAPIFLSMRCARLLPEWCWSSLRTFGEHVDIVGRGVNSRLLQRAKGQQGDATSTSISVISFENVSRLSLETSDGVSLVTAASRVLEFAADSVSLEIASIASTLVSKCNHCASLLNEELTAVRSFSRHCSVRSDELASLLRRQGNADEALGIFEENLASFSLSDMKSTQAE